MSKPRYFFGTPSRFFFIKSLVGRVRGNDNFEINKAVFFSLERFIYGGLKLQIKILNYF